MENTANISLEQIIKRRLDFYLFVAKLIVKHIKIRSLKWTD